MSSVPFKADRIVAMNLRTDAGVKTVRVKFPTDDQWIARQKRCKVVIKQLGRGKSETDVLPTEDIDEPFVASLRAEEVPGPEIDKFEATKIVSILTQAKIEDVQDAAGGFEVKLRLPSILTVHAMKMPMESDKAEYRRSIARVVDLPYSKQEITVNLAVVPPIYARLLISAEGYDGTVPVIHQSAVLKAIIEASDASTAQDEDENF